MRLGNCQPDETINLTQNFTLADICLEYCHFVQSDDEILSMAKQICNFWLKRKLANGLIPEFMSARHSFLDACTDFSITLRRLYQLTGEAQYKKESNHLVEAIIKNHIWNNYLVTRVNENSVPNPEDIAIKYNLLFLKAWIAYSHASLSPFTALFKDR